MKSLTSVRGEPAYFRRAAIDSTTRLEGMSFAQRAEELASPEDFLDMPASDPHSSSCGAVATFAPAGQGDVT